MKFIPQFTFNFSHIRPGVHSICLNIRDLLCILLLLFLVSFDILKKVSFFWWFDNDLCYFLWCIDLGDFHFFLEPLSDNFSNRHIVDFLRGAQLRRTNGSYTTSWICLKKNLLLLLSWQILGVLLFELILTLIWLLDSNIVLVHCRLLALGLPLIFKEYLLKIWIELLSILLLNSLVTLLLLRDNLFLIRGPSLLALSLVHLNQVIFGQRLLLL
jgi:hypothetical protein